MYHLKVDSVRSSAFDEVMVPTLVPTLMPTLMPTLLLLLLVPTLLCGWPQPALVGSCAASSHLGVLEGSSATPKNRTAKPGLATTSTVLNRKVTNEGQHLSLRGRVWTRLAGHVLRPQRGCREVSNGPTTVNQLPHNGQLLQTSRTTPQIPTDQLCLRCGSYKPDVT
ncbi:hypothetical protein PLESTF_000693500 [Pleodorina starrii]|nr:hypothetical protein PLESTM_001557800 [Pleodorina starrii]GLC68456.1 hypothetical protein PLESTF_000693500 [Pleodorina starrii]